MAKSLSARLTLPTFMLAWGWLIFHFALTAVYLAPVSTLKARLYPSVLTYMDPYFRQRWSLFAPDPNGRTRYLQIACKVREQDGSLTESAFYNVTQRFLDTTWSTRIGPGFRVQRAYKAPLTMLDSGSSAWFAILAYQAKGDPDAKARLDASRSRTATYRKARAREVAQRIASAECYRQFPGAQIAEVNPAFDVIFPLPFHQRKSADERESMRVDFGWMPVIDAPGLRRAEES
jgi:uncharacterized protein DUF5819